MSGRKSTTLPAQLGYSDEQLEELCKLVGIFDSRTVPWAVGDSENTGFGRAFRAVARYPRVFPLFFSCDHGVGLGSRLWANETSCAYPVYLSWLAKKSNGMNQIPGKRSYHVPHPWVHYRKSCSAMRGAKGVGTLVFFPHSNATTSQVFDVDQYMTDLKRLPEKCHPIAICLSFHDVDAGLHKTLRKYDLPIVTVGHASSQSFVDRFYSLLFQFRYSSSPNIGSHTMYVMEAGVPFFLFGPYPKIQVKGSALTPDGVYGEEILGDAQDVGEIHRFMSTLYTVNDEVTVEQFRLVSHYMGLDSTVTRNQLTWIVWREFLSLRNWLIYLRETSRRVLLKLRGATP